MTTNATPTHTDLDAWLLAGRTLTGGFVMDEEHMDQIFQMVNPAKHGQPSWKYPIDAYVSKTLAHKEELEKVVAWFCGGIPTVVEAEGGNDWHVTGAGYYTWIGA